MRYDTIHNTIQYTIHNTIRYDTIQYNTMCMASLTLIFTRSVGTLQRPRGFEVKLTVSLLWPFFSSCFNYASSKWLIFQIEINKKHNFWKTSYHSWVCTNDNKTSVIERKQNHKLWIISTAFIRGFTCMLNFAISWIQCPHNEINNNITLSISRNPGHSVFH